MSNDLHAELDEVERLLFQVPSELGPPLHDLVESQVNSLTPHFRARFVLAAATSDRDEADIREKRIHLAAALETLSLALNIHKHLLDDESSTNGLASNKSLVGSMILAGDYCFSRSAEFAASTNEPTVVAIFSDVLAAVSEGHLRQLHGKTLTPYDEVPVLLMAGVHAAIELCQPSTESKEATLRISQALATSISPTNNQHGKVTPITHDSATFHKTLELLPVRQQKRWRSLIETVSGKNAS